MRPYRVGQELIDPHAVVTVRQLLASNHPRLRAAAQVHAWSAVEDAFSDAAPGDRPGTLAVARGPDLTLVVDTLGPALKGAWLHAAWYRRRAGRPVLSGYVVLDSDPSGEAVLRFDGEWSGRGRPVRGLPSLSSGRLRREPRRLLGQLAAVIATRFDTLGT